MFRPETTQEAEFFAEIRSVLERKGLSERQAIKLAKDMVPVLRPYLTPDMAEGHSSHRLAGMVRKVFEDVVVSHVTLAEEEFGEAFAPKHWDLLPLWLEEAYNCGLMVAHALTSREGSTHYIAEMAEALAGKIGIMDAPPLVVQEAQGKPVHLYYWTGAVALLEIALHVAHDWVEQAESQTLVQQWGTITEMESRGYDQVPIPPDMIFIRYYNKGRVLLHRLRVLAELQWNLADVLGLLYGRDHLGLAWYRYAQAYVGGSRERLRRFMDKRNVEIAWMEGKEPDETLEMAVACLRHVLNKWPIPIPVVTRRILLMGGQLMGFHLVVNHPFVSQEEIQEEAAKALHRLHLRRRMPLTEDDSEFLDAVKRAGLELGSRAPRGFWLSFQSVWNENHPDRPKSIESLRVRYHRLNERLKRK